MLGLGVRINKWMAELLGPVGTKSLHKLATRADYDWQINWINFEQLNFFFHFNFSFYSWMFEWRSQSSWIAQKRLFGIFRNCCAYTFVVVSGCCYNADHAVGTEVRITETLQTVAKRRFSRRSFFFRKLNFCQNSDPNLKLSLSYWEIKWPNAQLCLNIKNYLNSVQPIDNTLI